jgi:hypothetical protein
MMFEATHTPEEALMDEPTEATDELSAACLAWQGGRDVGSTPIRAGARVLTGVPHYFDAPFIREHDAQAQRNPEILRDARALLRALADTEPLDADGWARAVQLPTTGFAGRGIKEKPAEDPQITGALASGTLTMPLWGATLDEQIARSYGTRFTFVIEGPFPAIPAWRLTHWKPEEQELICGGRYAVVDVDGPADTQTVRLRYDGPVPLLADDEH